MTNRWLFAPVAVLAAFAGYLGLRLGQPISETQIITQFATLYVAKHGDGAAITDCLATSSPLEDVRLVVICTHPSGALYRYPSGPRGQLRVIETENEI